MTRVTGMVRMARMFGIAGPVSRIVRFACHLMLLPAAVEDLDGQPLPMERLYDCALGRLSVHGIEAAGYQQFFSWPAGLLQVGASVPKR